MNVDKLLSIKTLGELKRNKYQTKTIKRELRDNLILKLKNKEKIFTEILGFDETVIPDIQRAVLSQHNIILLGLRGQAKTRIARLMIHLMDEYIPFVKDSELLDDPFFPVSRFAKDVVRQAGDETPIDWLYRQDRYTEKLATPDVSIADLIGDVDPIKAASLKLPYSDERVIHFGLIPRSHRSIFTINELPDLQPRIQVALFNILQEGDIQIRGFKLRLPLDILFIFTANPEDYTNRGSIVTPLKDRIESQILTHYPKSIEIARQVTEQESVLADEQKENIVVPELAKILIEQVAFEARASEYVDRRSGVSARLPISAYENLHSAAERRALINKESKTTVRISDFIGIIPSITGKIELVYEGEQEGPVNVAILLLGKAIRAIFPQYLPNPESNRRNIETSPYQKIVNWFSQGNELDLLNDISEKEYRDQLLKISGLKDFVQKYFANVSVNEQFLLMEFVLHGLVEFSYISKHSLETGFQFRDLLSGMMSLSDKDEEDRFSDEDFNV